MQEILTDVFTWARFSERHGYDFNSYLVRFPPHNVCVDPVEMPDDVLSEIAQLGVASIVLTNRNHVRASNKVRERTKAPVFIHPADAAKAKELGADLDGYLEVGQRIGPLVIHSAQGKSPGEICLHWPERRVLFVGDACIGKPPGACSILPDRIMDDPPALRQSLRHIALELDFDALLVGDGVPILTGGRAALEALTASFREPGKTSTRA